LSQASQDSKEPNYGKGVKKRLKRLKKWYVIAGIASPADALERQAVFALARDVDGRTTLDASCGMRHYPLALEPT